MKKYFNYAAFCVVVLSICASPLLTHAAFQAADAIGQRRGGGPAFTLSGANNAPNDLGLNHPSGVAVDTANHRLFVADNFNSRILVYPLTATGTVASYTPDFVLGAPDAFTKNTATSAKKGYADALAYDPVNSRLFAVDSFANRVLVFDVAPGTLTNNEDASYVLGQTDFTSDSSGTSASTLNGPSTLAYDSGNQRLFVGDTSNRRILVFNASPLSIANGMAASAVLGQPDFTSAAFLSVGTSTLNSPTGLAYDSTNQRLFVSDSGNRRALVFDVATSTLTNNEDASYVLGQTDFTSSSGHPISSSTFVNTSEMTYDNGGQRLFVGDWGGNRILVFNASPLSIANGMAASAVLGQADFTSSATGTSATTLNDGGALVAFAYDAVNNKLFATDPGNNRVLIYGVATVTNGQAAIGVLGHVIAGQPSFDHSGANNGPGVDGLTGALSTVLDSAGHRLFVADSGNNRVLEFDLDSQNDFIDYNADHVLGQPDMYLSTSGISAVNMDDPAALAYDSVNHRLFVGEGSSNNRILVFNVATLTDGMAAAHVLGQPDFTTHHTWVANATSVAPAPAGLFYDQATARLFAADSGGNRVLVFDAATSTLTDGMAAAHVLGEPNFTTGPGFLDRSASVMSSAYGLTYDGSRLFAADPNNGRVLVFDAASSTLVDGMPASYVLGQPDFDSGSSPTTSSNSIQGAYALTYDSIHHRLFVSDNSSNRVLGFNVAPNKIANGEAATVVLGQPDFTSNDSGTSAAAMNGPAGLLYDTGNKLLYVDDSGNNRILAYKQVKITTVALPAATVGQHYGQEITTENQQGTVSFALADGSSPLPPGMTVGSVDGIPAAPGDYTFTIQANDSVVNVGQLFDDQTYTLTVNPSSEPNTPTITSSGGGGGGGTLAYNPPANNPSTPPSSDPAVLQAQIKTLEAQIAALQAQLGIPAGGSGSPSSPQFPRDLTLGSTGPDVKALQVFLNAHGFPLAASGPGSPGQETDFFGPLTQAALQKFQTANSISPAAGYFGPKTRQKVSALLGQ